MLKLTLTKANKCCRIFMLTMKPYYKVLQKKFYNQFFLFFFIAVDGHTNNHQHLWNLSKVLYSGKIVSLDY